MSASIPLQLAGERVRLHGDRALYWPARKRLLIADLHLGKADAFRRAGIALPRGGTALDLDRLSALLAASGAQSLWVLGDLLHGPLVDTHWRDAWQRWRSRHAGLDIAVIPGNHDRALGAAGLALRVLADTFDDGPFALRHEPQAHPHLHVMCGHVHPVSALPGLGRRWPVFWLRERLTVLPAFSQFTGGSPVTPRAGESLIACVEGDAIALPAPGGP